MTALSGVDKSLELTEQRVDTRSFNHDGNFIPNSGLMTELLWSLTTTSEHRLIRDYIYQLTSDVKRRIEMLRINIMAENSKVSEDEIAAPSVNLIQELACQALLIYEAKPANKHQIVEEF